MIFNITNLVSGRRAVLETTHAQLSHTSRQLCTDILHIYFHP